MNRYIYKITHVPSGKNYIGQRCCHCPIEEDRYWGSGTDWKLFFKSNPIEEFKKQILAIAKTNENLSDLEKRFVGDLYKTDPLCMNLISGGGLPTELSPKSRSRISQALKGRPSPLRGTTFEKEHKRRISISMKGNENGKFTKGIKRSEEFKKNVSIRQKKRFENPTYREFWKTVTSHPGEKHPNFGKPAYNKGTHWFNNGVKQIMTDVCPEGYTPGRLSWKTN